MVQKRLLYKGKRTKVQGPLTAKQAAQVAKIAARTTKAVAETKTAHQAVEPTSMNERQILSYNLINQMGFTNSGNQTGEGAKVIGDEILLKGYGIRGLIRNNPGNSNIPTTVTMALIKTKQYRTITNLTDGEIFAQYSASSPLPRFDSSKCQVLWKHRTTIKPVENNVGGQVPFEKYVNLKGQKFSFRDLVADQDAKGYNLYLVFFAGNFGATKGSINAARVEFCHELFYKDP